jgi:hypothetical protein
MPDVHICRIQFCQNIITVRDIRAYSMQSSVQLHRLLIESLLNPCYHVNSTSSGIFDDSHKLYCIEVYFGS